MLELRSLNDAIRGAFFGVSLRRKFGMRLSKRISPSFGAIEHVLEVLSLLSLLLNRVKLLSLVLRQIAHLA